MGEPDQVDVLRFDELTAAAAAMTGDADALAVFGEAVALWRGPAGADLGDALRLHPAAVGLARRRLAAVLSAADLALRLGRTEQAVDFLDRLAVDERFHEGLHARLMLALAGSGQQAAALRLFAEVRSRLADELGVEPGAELAAAQLRVLRHDLPVAGPAAAAVRNPRRVRPAQLPADVPAFTGRAAELAALDAVLLGAGAGASAETPTVAMISAVAGAAGIGKTAIALHWAHRNRDRFPDGQLYVDLRGHARISPMRQLDALANLLPALGVPADQIPAELEQAAALYRSLLADRRVLVVLDNAGGAEQVRPLLPGSPSCPVLITSRNRLAGLVAREGARRLTVGLLSAAESQALLSAVLGPDRLRAEPVEAARLAELCGYLPLAIRVAAANLAEHDGQSLADYNRRLADGNRLAELEVGDDDQAAVRAAFDLSYRALGPEPGRVFGLLGAMPGRDLSLDAVAAAAGLPVAAAAGIVETLAGAHLVTEPAPGRFALHDLLRLYAAERASADGGADTVGAAAHRLLDWYLVATHEATELTYPQFGRLPLPASAADGPVVSFADATAAWAWLDNESGNILGAIRQAAGLGLPAYAWLLTDALHGHLGSRLPLSGWTQAATDGLSAATECGDDLARAAMWRNNGNLLLKQGDFGAATSMYSKALDVFTDHSRHDEAFAMLANLGMVHSELGQLAEAEATMTRALRLAGDAVPAAKRAVLLSNLAILLDEDHLARFAEAAEHAGAAVRLYRELGDDRGEVLSVAALVTVRSQLDWAGDNGDLLARAELLLERLGDRDADGLVLNAVACAYYAARRSEQALQFARRAMATVVNDGYAPMEALVANTVARILVELGQPAEAEPLFRRALELAEPVGYRGEQFNALFGLAGLAWSGRAVELAGELFAMALEVARPAGMRLRVAHCQLALARVSNTGGDHDAAGRLAADALDRYREIGYPSGAAAAAAVLSELDST